MTDQKLPENRPSIPNGPFLSQLAGMEEATEWGQGLIQDIALYRARRLAWSEVDAGCVLHGPPGTGKTTFARALAATAEIPLIATSYADWTRGRYVTDVIKGIKESFRLAAASAPCVLAIDELDSVPNRATLSEDSSGSHQIVNAVLEQLDGHNRHDGVVVVGACNHVDKLDAALVRSGRLGRSILIPMPSLDALQQILVFHLGADARGVGDLSRFAVMCAGLSGADVAALCRTARQRARRNNRSLSADDLMTALESKAPKIDRMSEWRIAVHEAGHAVAADRMLKSKPITLSMISAANPVTQYLRSIQPSTLTRSLMINVLIVLLAGRAAEDVLLQDISVLSGGDTDSELACATRMAASAVAAQGLSLSGNLFWRGNDKMILPHHLATEVEELLRNAYESACQLITKEAELIARVAEALFTTRALSHQDFLRLDNRAIQQRPAPVQFRAQTDTRQQPISQRGQGLPQVPQRR